MKNFGNFTQSAVVARTNRDDYLTSSVVGVKLKLQAKCFTSYQSLDGNRYTVANYLSGEKTHGAMGNKMFNRFSFINDQFLK